MKNEEEIRSEGRRQQTVLEANAQATIIKRAYLLERGWLQFHTVAGLALCKEWGSTVFICSTLDEAFLKECGVQHLASFRMLELDEQTSISEAARANDSLGKASRQKGRAASVSKRKRQVVA